MKKLILCLVFSLMSNSAFAAGSDYKVIQVYSCGDDVGIQMESGLWLVARQSQIGEKRVDRIMSLALVLLSTGKSLAYADAGTVLASWCGISNVKPITVFGIRSQ